MNIDVEWMVNHVKTLVLEIAAIRGAAQQQLEAKDAEIAALKRQLQGGNGIAEPAQAPMKDPAEFREP